MPRDFSRTDRIADQIQKELAWLIQREVKDPRVGMVTISDVRVSKDLGYADVYFTLLTAEEVNETSPEVQKTERALQGASGFLRSAIGKAMKLRVIPRLRFHFDKLAGESRHLDSLINQAVASDRRHHGDDSEGSSD